MTNEQSTRKGPSRRIFAVGAMITLIIAGVAIKSFFFENDFLFSGTLEATKVDLSAQLPSSIAAFGVQEGDEVKENQEVVALSCEDFKVAAELANQNYERNSRLFRSGTISQDTMDQVKNKKEEVDVHLKWCSIRSPIQGTVLSRYHEPGEWVNAGVKLVTLANIKDIWAYIYVPQITVAHLKPGMKLTGILSELSGRKFLGKIVKINAEAEFTPKNVQTRSERTRLVFGVKVSFLGANEEQILKPGMTIELQLPKE
ncbi:efflux RND transporter periplasmic adaptor subunit [Bdellovibrionota bacterium FG-1]